MRKFNTFSEFAFYVLLLLPLPPAVNSNETPTPRQCAVCLEKDCANGVRRIYQAGSDTPVWPKKNSQTGIQNCSMENLKPDAPCKMANGSLAQLANETLHFDGIDTYDVRRPFHSQISPCADLNLLSKPSPVIQVPIHIMPTPTDFDLVVNNEDILIATIVSSFFGFLIIFGVLILKRNRRGQGQDGDHRHGNNGVLPHDTEHRDEITIQMQPLKGEVANGNVNGVH